MNNKPSVLCFILLALASSHTAPAIANIVLNGSFEQPILDPGEARLIAGPGTGGTGAGIPNWTVVGNNIYELQTTYAEPTHGIAFNAQDGLSALDVTGDANTGPTDGIQQTVPTIAGHLYQLSFYVGRAQSSNGNPVYQQPATVDVSIDGGARIGFTNSNSPIPGTVDWQLFNLNFTALASNTTIAFLNGTGLATSEAGLDNVSLIDGSVPEPGTVTIMGTELIMVVGLLVFCCRRNSSSTCGGCMGIVLRV